MKIALIMDGADLSSKVAENFSSGQWLLIVEEEGLDVLEPINRAGKSDEQLATLIVDSGSEGVLCGPIERDAFLIISDEGCVTRYHASGLSGFEAVEKFKNRDLELIRDYIGSEGHAHHHYSSPRLCSGKHH